MRTILDFSDYERRAVDHGCQEVVARTPEERHMLDRYIGAEKRVQQILRQVMTRSRRNGLIMDRLPCARLGGSAPHSRLCAPVG